MIKELRKIIKENKALSAMVFVSFVVGLAIGLYYSLFVL